jgi:hypothetical protein
MLSTPHFVRRVLHLPPFLLNHNHFTNMPSRISKRSKKKRQKNGRPAKIWGDNEVIETLAWADFNFEIDPTWEEFNATIVIYLQDTCGVQRTLAQVQGKLNQLWRTYGRDRLRSFPNLIKQEGSRCLENPDFLLHEAIARRVKALQHNQFVAQLSKRSTRSASNTPGKRLARARSIMEGGLVMPSSSRRKVRDRSVRESPCPQAQSPTRIMDQDLIQVRLGHGC